MGDRRRRLLTRSIIKAPTIVRRRFRDASRAAVELNNSNGSLRRMYGFRRKKPGKNAHAWSASSHLWETDEFNWVPGYGERWLALADYRSLALAIVCYGVLLLANAGFCVL